MMKEGKGKENIMTRNIEQADIHKQGMEGEDET